MKKWMLVLTVLVMSFGASAAHHEKKVVFVAGPKSHGYNAHEHNAGALLLAKALNESGLGIEAEVIYDPAGWPTDLKAFDGASTIVIYCDGGGKHVANTHVKEIDKMQAKGVGVVCLHYGVETIDGEPGDGFLRWMGGYYQLWKSVNPHWTPHFTKLPKHEITQGVKPFHINDEWYFNMRFREGMEGVTPILSAVPPVDVIPAKDHHHGSTPDGRAAVESRAPMHVAWASENKNGSRGFGFTGGHFHDNWQDDNFRRIALNAIVWTAHVKVPKGGVKSKTPTDKQLRMNQDYPEDLKKVRADRYAAEHKKK